jgi:hypothetical protein
VNNQSKRIAPMKKLTALLMSLCLGLFVVGCGGGGDEPPAQPMHMPPPGGEPIMGPDGKPLPRPDGTIPEMPGGTAAPE